jgi:hypothetical protein
MVSTTFLKTEKVFEFVQSLPNLDKLTKYSYKLYAVLFDKLSKYANKTVTIL